MKIVLPLIIFLLSSCVKEIPIDLPSSKRQVIITGLIYPRSPISLNISNLMAFSDTTKVGPQEIIDISILQDGISIGNLSGPGPDIYTSIYPNAGYDYTLIVRTENDTLIANTMVPTEILLTKADYWFSPTPSQKFQRPCEASIQWEDPAGIDNFYELQILIKDMKALSFYQFDQIDNPVLQQESDLDYAPSSFLFTDQQFDGKSYTLSLRFGIGYSVDRLEKASVVLRNLSKEYYYFKKSWHKHIFLQNTSIQWDGELSFNNVYSVLFQGDPVSMYSNIKEGLGIFAGFSQDIRKFKFVQ